MTDSKQWLSRDRLSGYVTTMASVDGINAHELESRLGLGAGYLSQGYAIYELDEEVGPKDFAWRDKTWYSDGLTGTGALPEGQKPIMVEKDGKQFAAGVPRLDRVRGELLVQTEGNEQKVDAFIKKILDAAHRRLSVRSGPERIVKVISARDDKTTYPNSLFRNIPQWELLRPKTFNFKLVSIVLDGATNQLLSGAAWWHANQANYPNSSAVADLVPGFREKVETFIAALRLAGAIVTSNATLRNKTRAHLMHYSFKLAKGLLQAKDVPDVEGCAIVWDHGIEAHSRKAAKEMVDLFKIVFQPSLTSLHIAGNAIDMNISWSGTLKIVDGKGVTREIGAPASGAANAALHKVGGTYGVHKLLSDAPHWSSTGH